MFGLKIHVHLYLFNWNVQPAARAPAVTLDLQPGGDHFGPEDFQLSLNEVHKHSISDWIVKLPTVYVNTLKHNTLASWLLQSFGLIIKVVIIYILWSCKSAF